MKTTELFIASAFRVDDNEVISSYGDVKAESDINVGKLDISRKELFKSKSWIKSELNCTEYPEDKEGVYLFHKP